VVSTVRFPVLVVQQTVPVVAALEEAIAGIVTVALAMEVVLDAPPIVTVEVVVPVPILVVKLLLALIVVAPVRLKPPASVPPLPVVNVPTMSTPPAAYKDHKCVAVI
jgi:hypothetical protein